MVTTPALTLMDRLINRHSTINALSQGVAILILFAEFITTCREEKLFPRHTDRGNQNYRIKNKFIQCHKGKISLSVADIERAAILIVRHMHR